MRALCKKGVSLCGYMLCCLCCLWVCVLLCCVFVCLCVCVRLLCGRVVLLCRAMLTLCFSFFVCGLCVFRVLLCVDGLRRSHVDVMCVVVSLFVRYMFVCLCVIVDAVAWVPFLVTTLLFCVSMLCCVCVCMRVLMFCVCRLFVCVLGSGIVVVFRV